jgi:hypothetical protein
MLLPPQAARHLDIGFSLLASARSDIVQILAASSENLLPIAKSPKSSAKDKIQVPDFAKVSALALA